MDFAESKKIFISRLTNEDNLGNYDKDADLTAIKFFITIILNRFKPIK